MNTTKNRTEHAGRILWLDVLKGVLIYFVLLSHSYPPVQYRRFFTPFFLTMFFFVSGYTFSIKDTFFVFFKKKCRRLVIPLFVLGGIRMFVCLLIDRGSFVKRFCGLLLQRSGIYDEMWFLSCLFVSCLIFYNILAAAEKQGNSVRTALFLFLVSFLFLLLGCADITILNIKFPWEAELACMMTGYTALGYLYRQYEAELTARLNKLSLVFSSVLYLLLVLFFPNDVDIHMEFFPNLFLFLISSLVCILPIVHLCKVLSTTVLCRLLSFLGQNTLFYFAFGGLVRIVFYAVTDRLGLSNELLLPILCSCFTVIFLAYPAKMVHQYLPWMIGES